MARLGLVLAAAGVMAASAAAAETPLRLSVPTSARAPAAPVTVAARLPYEGRQVSLPPGIVRTAVERRFSAETLVGSAGFLCGLQDHPVHDGSAGAYGSDPDGRFLGASLRLRFH